MDSYSQLTEEAIEHIKFLKFDKKHAWHHLLVTLYSSIVEYSDSLNLLAIEKKPISIPVITRSLLEAYVDFKNLADDKSYGYSLEIGFIKEWLRITTEAGKKNNQFLNLIAESKIYDVQVKEWEDEIASLREKGYKKFTYFQKFEKAEMVEEYHSIYNFLCAHAHNNKRALNDRHIELSADQKDFSLVLFMQSSDTELYLQIGEQCLKTASQVIHQIMKTGYEHVFVKT